MSRKWPVLSFAAAVTVGLVAHCFAVPVTFNVTSASSSLVLGGNVAGSGMSQQTSNSLTTSYSGTINADLTATTIQFTSATLNAALQPQNQQPDDDGFGSPGNGPANYGFSFTSPFGGAVGALRAVSFNLTSSVLNISGTSVPASGQSFSFADGALDYNAGISSGRKDMTSAGSSGNGAANGSIQTVGSVQTLTVPVATSFGASVLTSGDSELTFSGTIVATRIVPEPVGAASALLVGLAMMRRRRPARGGSR